MVLPEGLLQQSSLEQQRLILAHELAHLKRRDHLTRWLEWLACVCFWWNPVTWLARRQLRTNEELCCDALVLDCLEPEPKKYANSLLTAVEFLSSPILHVPSTASGMTSGGNLERRFKMIMSDRPMTGSPWPHTCIVLCALICLPLGVAFAGEPDYEAVTRRLIAAVKAGELTEPQAEAMMGALTRARFAERLAASDEKSRGRDREDAKPSELVEHYRRLGITPEKLRGLMKLFLDAGVRREAIEPATGVLLRQIYRVKEGRGKRSGVHADLKKYLQERLRFNEKQLALFSRMAQRIAGAKGRSAGAEGLEQGFKKLCIDREKYHGIIRTLMKQGVAREKVPDALGAILRSIEMFKSAKRPARELPPELRRHLEKNGFSSKQIALIQRYAMRIAAGQRGASGKSREPKRSDRRSRGRDLEPDCKKLGIKRTGYHAIIPALMKQGVKREKVLIAMGAMYRSIQTYKSAKRPTRKMDPKLRSHLEKSGFSSKHIALIQDYAMRIALGRRGADKRPPRDSKRRDERFY